MIVLLYFAKIVLSTAREIFGCTIKAYQILKFAFSANDESWCIERALFGMSMMRLAQGLPKLLHSSQRFMKMVQNSKFCGKSLG